MSLKCFYIVIDGLFWEKKVDTTVYVTAVLGQTLHNDSRNTSHFFVFLSNWVGV